MEQNVAQLAYFERVWAWFETHKKQAVWGGGIAVAVGLAVAFFIWRHGEKDVAAGEALSNVYGGQAVRSRNPSQTVEAFLRIAAEHPGTAAGAYALLQAAAISFDEAKYTDAQAQFQRFNREYPDSPFRGQAMLGIAACLDSQGKINEAAAAYEDLIRRRPNENVAPQAKFALARIYEAQNRFDPARNLYSDILRNESLNSSIGSEAGIRLEELNMKHPPPAPAAASAPAALPGLPAFQTNQP